MADWLRGLTEMHCYIDESIHERLGFFAIGFVFTVDDPNEAVRAALKSVGMDPDGDEFKSGAFMSDNTQMQDARKALLGVVNAMASVGVVFAARTAPVRLGKQCLQALQSMLIRNGIRSEGLTVHVDEGIFQSTSEAQYLIRVFHFLASAILRPYERSHACRGIQLADLTAHLFAQVVREHLTGEQKMVDVGGANTGYPSGTLMPLSIALIASVRSRVLARRMVYEGDKFDPATDPVVIGPDDDPVTYGQNPEVFGWGVQVTPDASENLRRAVVESLGRVWLGCMH
jgi:hypothetical protein